MSNRERRIRAKRRRDRKSLGNRARKGDPQPQNHRRRVDLEFPPITDGGALAATPRRGSPAPSTGFEITGCAGDTA